MNLVKPEIILNTKNDNFKKTVKIALIFNFSMFFIEFLSGIVANSMALILDSLDFLFDSINYLIAIYVLRKSLKIQSYSAIIKAVSMLFFAIFMIYNIFSQIFFGESFFIKTEIPNHNLMIAISFLAFCVNLFISILLFKFRNNSSNQQSVWLCSRNDVINNLLVIIAGFLVLHSASQIPDLIIAFFMAFLIISSSFTILKTAFSEIKSYKN